MHHLGCTLSSTHNLPSTLRRFVRSQVGTPYMYIETWRQSIVSSICESIEPSYTLHSTIILGIHVHVRPSPVLYGLSIHYHYDIDRDKLRTHISRVIFWGATQQSDGVASCAHHFMLVSCLAATCIPCTCTCTCS